MIEDWDSIEEEEQGGWEEEMNKMSKVEQLKAILSRLREFKRQGGEGIEEKIEDVEQELKKYLKWHWKIKLKIKIKIKKIKKIKKYWKKYIKK